MMWSLILAAQLCAVPTETTAVHFAEIAAQVQTGTLLFSEGDCLAVKVFSGSPYTHVGMVVVEDGRPIVYDAMNGAGVRRTPLPDYLRRLVPSDVEVAHPRTPFDDDDRAALVRHLQSQLGRPYRVHHHATGRRSDGVHCAEYVTDALIAAHCLTAQNPPRVSPGSLRQGVLDGRVYVTGGRYVFEEAPPLPAAAGETWCQRCCRETANCCSTMCRQLSRWFLCTEK